MADKRTGFEDVRTVLQPESPGYERTALRRKLELRWTDGGREHAVTVQGKMVLGSASGADLVVADPAVSRVHAEIDVRDDGPWLRDLGSRNGTYIEGVQIALARIPDGARLRLGSTVLQTAPASTPTPVELWPHDSFGPLVGRSVVMRELFARIARVAPSDATRLVQGETGTGKEVVARAIHEASPRGRGPLVTVDCAALPENLLESELFGHAKGAFTGAQSARVGAIESAEGGTVFLDEIGELSPAMQPKLLRVLESRSVRRLGETAYRKIDVRFVSATHRDLRTMINTGAFREDLYFRISVIPLVLPPLRERPQDIAGLVQHFVPKGSGQLGPEIIAEIAGRPWLGNVRELRNFVERALVLGAREALAMASGAAMAAAPAAPAGWNDLAAAFEQPLAEARTFWMDRLEREYLRRLLERHARNVPAAAQAAGVDRTYVYRLIKKHGL